ncbi:uncharacterized protein [Panulirus ornatus]|uniref:uncharacterized protein isoform X2 n=1 Tax=Panulirus ornatus TaxID=150431 RepID=UPI003A84C7FC
MQICLFMVVDSWMGRRCLVYRQKTIMLSSLTFICFPDAGESFASRKIVVLYNLRVFLHGSVVLYAGESFASRKIVVLYNLRVFLHGSVVLYAGESFTSVKIVVLYSLEFFFMAECCTLCWGELCLQEDSSVMKCQLIVPSDSS